MLVVETVAKIRREHFGRGKGVKRIARELRLSRNTVRKVLRSGETSFEYERSEQPHPRLGAFIGRLEGMLETNAAAARKDRLTLTRIADLLGREGYEGGYDAVRRYAGRWALRCRGVSSPIEAFVPLSFAPGDAYQFDWSHDQVEIGGKPMTVKVAHLRLSHSRRFYIRAYPRETQEMVFDAHARAFTLFGGVTARGIYDNMKTAVDAVFAGKARRFNRRFEQMCSHYLIEPVACTPASGWEKGQVENQVGYARDNIFKPRLRFRTLEELTAGWRSRQGKEVGDRRCGDRRGRNGPQPSTRSGQRGGMGRSEDQEVGVATALASLGQRLLARLPRCERQADPPARARQRPSPTPVIRAAPVLPEAKPIQCRKGRAPLGTRPPQLYGWL